MSKPIARVLIAQSARNAWTGAIEPWCAKVVPTAWQNAAPAAVVVPRRYHANAIKEQLARTGRSHLGLRFLTPRSLRETLFARAGAKMPLREDLQLLLAATADEMLREQLDDQQMLAAKAVLRAPDHLLRTLERFEAAGWKFEDLKLTTLQPIVRRFRDRLQRCGLDLTAGLDRNLSRRPTDEPPLFSDLLITGFDSGHWSQWPLLKAAVSAAARATVVLEYPHGNVADMDSCWIGSWEELLGEAEPLAPAAHERPKPHDTFFTEEEMRGAAPAAEIDCLFAVGRDSTEEARAIAAMCVTFLADKSCTRVGLVFPAAGSLSRLVTHELSRLGIYHNDSFGRAAPGLFESAEWLAWLQLQRGPRINSLLRLLNALPNRAELFPGVSMRRFERTLRAAFAEILIDDVDLLLRSCATAESHVREIADTLAALEFLPAHATLAQFIAATQSAFARLGWKQQSLHLAQRGADWMASVSAEIPRTLYLRWLEETGSVIALRDEFGEHPYAAVQLVTVPEAVAGEWSHLIFARLNEGQWPPAEAGEFAADEDVQKFNRSIQRLNRRAARMGSQGEGHTSINADHSFYLGESERRQIATRQFETLIESATTAIGMTASLVQDSAPDRLWNPAEPFTRLYQQRHKHPLTQAMLKRLQEATAAWLKIETGPTKHNGAGVEQTKIAYDARRDEAQPSGEYDFALRTPVLAPPILSVSEFEHLLSSPALVWMKRYLDVEASDDDSNPWSAATGQWVHRWLANITQKTTQGAFAAIPDADAIDARIRAAADEKCAEIRGLCKARGKRVPDWWKSGWQNALSLARHLGAKLATIDGWTWMAAEWKLDGGEPITVGATSLLLRGRIDLLLARGRTAPSALSDSEPWIMDYKTGSSKKSLTGSSDEPEKRNARLRKKLLDGSAVQLALYAFAARQLGARDVSLSILSPVIRPVSPQLALADLHAQTDIFEELARMQQTGIFGMHGPIRSPWSFARAYPLATLAVDPDVIEQRWEKTHKPLAREEEEFW